MTPSSALTSCTGTAVLRCGSCLQPVSLPAARTAVSTLSSRPWFSWPNTPLWGEVAAAASLASTWGGSHHTTNSKQTAVLVVATQLVDSGPK